LPEADYGWLHGHGISFLNRAEIGFGFCRQGGPDGLEQATTVEPGRTATLIRRRWHDDIDGMRRHTKLMLAQRCCPCHQAGLMAARWQQQHAATAMAWRG